MKRTILRRRSKKRTIQNNQYLLDRAMYLRGHRSCQVCGIRGSTQIHHKRGRIGKALLDQDFWLAVCFWCHERITNEPQWAKEHGYRL